MFTYASHSLQDEEQMCRYRIVQDGLPLLLPHVTRQLLQPTVTELLHLIEDRSLYVPEEARNAPSKPAQADGEAADTSIKPDPTSVELPENEIPSTAGRGFYNWTCCAFVLNIFLQHGLLLPAM